MSASQECWGDMMDKISCKNPPRKLYRKNPPFSFQKLQTILDDPTLKLTQSIPEDPTLELLQSILENFTVELIKHPKICAAIAFLNEKCACLVTGSYRVRLHNKDDDENYWNETLNKCPQALPFTHLFVIRKSAYDYLNLTVDRDNVVHIIHDPIDELRYKCDTCKCKNCMIIKAHLAFKRATKRFNNVADH